MAALAAQSVGLPEGAALVVRSAVDADALAMLEFRRGVVASTDQIMTQPGEEGDLAEQQRYIERMNASDRSLLLLGSAGEEIAGTISLDGDRHGRKRLAHVCTLGITVGNAWRGRGIGTALTRAALDWAASHPAIELVTLCVFSSNPRAEALYRHFGFVRDGVRPKHAQIRPGEYVDDVMMTLFVKPGLAPAGYNTYVGCAERPATGA